MGAWTLTTATGEGNAGDAPLRPLGGQIISMIVPASVQHAALARVMNSVLRDAAIGDAVDDVDQGEGKSQPAVGVVLVVGILQNNGADDEEQGQ